MTRRLQWGAWDKTVGEFTAQCPIGYEDEVRRWVHDKEAWRRSQPHCEHEIHPRYEARELMAVRETEGSPGDEVDVDGFVDAKGIRYIGLATKRPSGQWVCLADVQGCLCLVEVKIRLVKPLPAGT